MTLIQLAFEALQRYAQAEADWQGSMTCAAFAEKWGLPKPRTANELVDWLTATRAEAIKAAAQVDWSRVVVVESEDARAGVNALRAMNPTVGSLSADRMAAALP